MEDRLIDVAPEVRKSAVLSECGRYRYWLERERDATLPKLAFVMLNPSTADAEIDDPTIRRCMYFARREGCGGIIVVNLFGARTPHPSHLPTFADPAGPMNGKYFYELRKLCVRVVAAWGADSFAKSEEMRTINWFQDMDCLGVTEIAKCPRHPLYQPSDREIVPFCRGGRRLHHATPFH